MNTVQLECFLAVAQYLNFSKAAESVSITQPAVSHQIGSLEDELGVKLFVRTSKSVSLTREGIMFISDAEQILKIAGSAKFRLSEKLEDEPVRISIGCHNQAELNVLTPALREMSRLYDDLLPYIDLTPFKSIDNQLKDQKIQLLLSFKSPHKQPFDYVELCRCQFMCLCQKDHPLAMAEAGLGFMIFPAIEDAYKGPLKAIPIKGVKEISFGVYYLRSQLEKQAKDMLGILKNQFAK